MQLRRRFRGGPPALVLIFIGFVLSVPMLTPLAHADLLVDISPVPSEFNGHRKDLVDWGEDPQPQPMRSWSIVAVVRPAYHPTGDAMTVVTNDLGGWNDDVLFGIAPETAVISDPWRWAIIHQDTGESARTKAVAARLEVVAGELCHVAATSDSEYLRFYVNGHPLTCPTQKEGEGLNFGNADTYIGGSAIGDGELRYFKGDIYNVKIYNNTLTQNDIEAFAAIEGLFDERDVNCECYVDNVEIQGDTVRAVTSIDFVNGYEVVTDLNNSRFLYRSPGELYWQVAETLAPPPLQGQHSIAWSDAVSPARYFVADTENHRIVSFESLAGDSVYSETGSIAGVRLVRPHDLEFNPGDGYFYGVTAPMWGADSDTMPKVLFRFHDIGVDEGVLEMAPPGTPLRAFYMRSVSVVRDTVYAVNSFGFPEPYGRPQVIRINDFATGNTTVYTAHPSFEANLQDVEYHNGWWYGTGNISVEHTLGPLLARWRTWADFENTDWNSLQGTNCENLSDLVFPHEDEVKLDYSHAYFLTKHDGRLFFTVYHNTQINKQDRVYEIIDGDSLVVSAPSIPADLAAVGLRCSPNPFGSTVGFHYLVPFDGSVHLSIYNVAGKLVATVVDEPMVAGEHEVVWDGLTRNGTDAASGVYFARLTINRSVIARRIVLIR
jgi:hypothetical protein